MNAVFGNPSDPTNPNCVQVVNCYYPESNAALYAGGKARKMADKAFYDGEVAYNLNGFYLCKRYYDGIHLGTGQAYEYFPAHVEKCDEYGLLSKFVCLLYPAGRTIETGGYAGT